VIDLVRSEEEGDLNGYAAALSFMVRASHKKADREKILSELDEDFFKRLLVSDQAKVRKN